MEKKKLSDAIHSATFNENIKSIKSIKDIYSEIKYADISNLKISVVEEEIEVFKWILENPDYDFNSLLESRYTKQELFEYFKIFYQGGNYRG